MGLLVDSCRAAGCTLGAVVVVVVVAVMEAVVVVGALVFGVRAAGSVLVTARTGSLASDGFCCCE